MSDRKNWRLAALTLAFVVVVAACGEKDELSGTPVKEGVACQPTSVERSKEDPTIAKVAKIAKLTKKDIVVGKGCGTDYARYLTFDMKGATADDAKPFFNTFGSDRPFTISLGTGLMLPALEANLQGMKVGGRRLVSLPAADAYAKGGSPEQGIGPDEDIEFLVELVAVADEQENCNANYFIPKGKTPDKPTKVDMPLSIGDELVKKDLVVGTGAEAVKGKSIEAHYLLVPCDTGIQDQSSWDTGETFTIPKLGDAGAIEGFSEGIVGMREGGVRQIDVPTKMAYPPGATLPDGSPHPQAGRDLVFIIKVVSVKDAPPETTTTTAPAGGSTSTTAAGGSTTTTTEAEGATTTTSAG